MHTQAWLYILCSSEELTVSPFALWFSPLQGLSPMSTWPIFSLDLSFTAASLPRESDTADLKETGRHFSRARPAFTTLQLRDLIICQKKTKPHFQHCKKINKPLTKTKIKNTDLYHSPSIELCMIRCYSNIVKTVTDIMEAINSGISTKMNSIKMLVSCIPCLIHLLNCASSQFNSWWG